MNKKAHLNNRQQRVLEYLEQHKTITGKEAYDKLGVMGLPKVIFDLKALGFKIEKDIVGSVNRYDQKVHFAKYRLTGYPEFTQDDWDELQKDFEKNSK